MSRQCRSNRGDHRQPFNISPRTARGSYSPNCPMSSPKGCTCMPCMRPALARLILGLFLMSLARLAYFKVFNDSSRYVSAVVTHATISVLLLPPSESCQNTKDKCSLLVCFSCQEGEGEGGFFVHTSGCSKIPHVGVGHKVTITVLLLPPSKSERWCSVQLVSNTECFLWYNKTLG